MRLYPVRTTGLHSLETAIQIIVARLYAGFLFPNKPINRNHVKKSDRNAEIIARHAAGEGLSDLARYYVCWLLSGSEGESQY